MIVLSVMFKGLAPSVSELKWNVLMRIPVGGESRGLNSPGIGPADRTETRMTPQVSGGQNVVGAQSLEKMMRWRLHHLHHLKRSLLLPRGQLPHLWKMTVLTSEQIPLPRR